MPKKEGYKSCTKQELLDIIEELETEAKDTESVCDHVADRIKALLSVSGQHHGYYGKLSLYDLGDELGEIESLLESYEADATFLESLEVWGVPLLKEPESLGELIALKDGLELFL